MKFSHRILALLLTVTSVQALEIQIDYTYDTDEKRAAMEAVADFFGEMIQDTMLEIDPHDFDTQFFDATWTPRITQPTTGVSNFALTTDMVIPEDTIIVYVGSRDLSGSIVGQAGPGGFTNASHAIGPRLECPSLPTAPLSLLDRTF